AALRCGLDTVGAWRGEGARRCMELLNLSGRPDDGNLGPFRLDRAHALYRALLAPVEDFITGKQLLVVATGPLGSIPLHVLLTDNPDAAPASPPPGASSSGKEAETRGLVRIERDGSDGTSFEAYAKASWLARRHAITMLPSVASLRA